MEVKKLNERDMERIRRMQKEFLGYTSARSTERGPSMGEETRVASKQRKPETPPSDI